MALARPWSAAALAAAALAVSGCRTQVTAGPTDHARATTRAFLADCARGEVTDAVDLLTPEARATFADAGSDRGACLHFLGFDSRGQDLSAVEQEDVLRRTRIGSVRGIHSDQFSSVTLQGPDGRRSSVDVERRAELWMLSRPAASEKLGTADPEGDARGAVTSFADLCAKGRYGPAEELLTVPGRQDFEAAGADADACLKFLGVSKPKEQLSTDEELRLLDGTTIVDVSEVDPTSATVAVTAPGHDEADVEAEDHGSAWELTKPSGTPRDAVASLLDSCAHEQYETAKDLLSTSARTAFSRHGADVGACLDVLGLADAVTGTTTDREEALDETDVSDVEAAGDKATVTIDVPHAGSHELDAGRHGELWDVAGPSSAA